MRYLSLILFLFTTHLYSQDLLNESNFLLTETIDLKNCEIQLARANKALNDLTSKELKNYIEKYQHQDILKSLWNRKLSLRKKFKELNQKGDLSLQCLSEYRETYRVIRQIEDYVEEHQIRHFPHRRSKSAFELNLNQKTNPDYSDFRLPKDLKSGDILLTRGNAYTSAAIASLGEFDTQFSHMSLVYINPTTKKIYTIESHIEIGVVSMPIQAHIDQYNMRTVVFRYTEDEALAHRAAEYMYFKALEQTQTGSNIEYDFAMDMNEDKRLFCSEVISHAFDFQSQGDVAIPMYLSHMLKRKSQFVKSIGVKSIESFIPADLEIDPRFDLVMEWKDATKLNDSHNKDAVLHAMYDWMDTYNYEIIENSSLSSFLYKNIAWPLRRVPWAKKYFKNKFPLNMSRKLIGIFAVLDNVGKVLQNELDVVNSAWIKKSDMALFPNEKKLVLDNFRKRVNDPKSKKLHRYFRPK